MTNDAEEKSDSNRIETPIQANRCVFVLGAGASAEHHLPVMRRFMSRAWEKYWGLSKASPDHFLRPFYNRMFDFKSECLKCSYLFERDWDNIEELYTQADLRRLAGESGAGTLCQCIAWCIWDVYRHYTPGAQPPLTEVFNKVYERRKLYPVVITTNYDVLIECALAAELNPWSFYYPGFELPAFAGNRLQTRILTESDDNPHGLGSQKRVPIVKLHGSANWFKTDRDSKDCIAAMCLGQCDTEGISITEPTFHKATFSEYAKHTVPKLAAR